MKGVGGCELIKLHSIKRLWGLALGRKFTFCFV